ncbi:MAG: hypothetical protein AW09_004631 [Candidatus Accumulibacter phosphatis]|uniref:Uncharacterized protein n=1 Tax=Candidatus Accumulibacter phosphatis TaxID=327160 RepID=A0A084Y6D2_9PROT|nr:MAG: hypothetical protein AW09_004631 [Candidatus Accumulibacter phosphatis]
MAGQFAVAGKRLPQSNVLRQGGRHAAGSFGETVIGDRRSQQEIDVESSSCLAIVCAKLMRIDAPEVQVGEKAPHRRSQGEIDPGDLIFCQCLSADCIFDGHSQPIGVVVLCFQTVRICLGKQLHGLLGSKRWALCSEP